METIILDNPPRGRITKELAKRAKALSKKHCITYQEAIALARLAKPSCPKKTGKGKGKGKTKMKANCPPTRSNPKMRQNPPETTAKHIGIGAASAVVNGGAGFAIEKVGAGKFFTKILSSEKLSDRGKIHAYHGARLATNAVIGTATTFATCAIAKKMKAKDKTVKSLKFGGLIGVGLSTLAEGIHWVKSARVTDSPLQNLIAKEKKRLNIPDSSTGNYLTIHKNQTGTKNYLTVDQLKNRYPKTVKQVVAKSTSQYLRTTSKTSQGQNLFGSGTVNGLFGN